MSVIHALRADLPWRTYCGESMERDTIRKNFTFKNERDFLDMKPPAGARKCKRCRRSIAPKHRPGCAPLTPGGYCDC